MEETVFQLGREGWAGFGNYSSSARVPCEQE